MKITVEFDNLTDAQAIALEDLFATMQQLGSCGGSRWVSFYADGDGSFRPKITVDGRKAEHTKLINTSHLWKNGEYRLDYDDIAWVLNKNKQVAI